MPSELHDLLVQKAARWCLRTRSCSFALCEPYSSGIEQPDVLAWQMRGHSILVECKASRADFLADKRKPTRKQPWSLGVGQERWYACAPGIVKPEDIPDGWGCLVLTKGGRFRRIKTAEHQEEIDRDIMRREFLTLLPALRNVHAGWGNQPWLKFTPERVEP